ncbi:hypothetical protein EDB19DRAFT_1674025, partial [Suillus lakei]
RRRMSCLQTNSSPLQCLITSRSLRWASTAETTYLVLKVASEKAHRHLPVHFGTPTIEINVSSPKTAVMYCAQPGRTQSSHWAPDVFTRMAIASCASLALQWGTVGAAVL